MASIRQGLLGSCILLLTMTLTSPAVQAAESATRAIGGFAADRGDAERRSHQTLEDYLAAEPKRSQARAETDSRTQKLTGCCDFYIYQARTRLFDDFDGDGYFTYLRVTFDVDTIFSEADVYADVYLVDSLGQFTRIYESDVFTIFGSSGTDDYEIEAELVAGFPPDDYDVLIEVYDAFDGSLAVEYGAVDSSALSLLPLEDISFDSYTPVVHAHGGGGGALSIPLLVLLGGLLLGRRCLPASGNNRRRMSAPEPSRRL